MPLLGRIAELGSLVVDVDIAPPSLDDVYRFYSDRASGDLA